MEQDSPQRDGGSDANDVRIEELETQPNEQTLAANSDAPQKERIGQWWRWYLLAAVVAALLGIANASGSLSTFFGSQVSDNELTAKDSALTEVEEQETSAPAPTKTPISAQGSPISPPQVGQDGILVLVGDLDESGEFTAALVEEMQTRLSEFPDIHVERLTKGIAPAVSASIVIRPDGESSPAAELRVKFEMLKYARQDESTGNHDASEDVSIQPDFIRFSVDTETDLDRLAAFAAALSLFNAGEHVAADLLFSAAVDGADDARTISGRLDLQAASRFYRGTNLIHLGRVKPALAELESLLPIESKAYSHNQGLSYSILLNLGMAYDYLGAAEQALNAHTQALAIARTLDDTRREAIALSNLGLAYRALEQAEVAVDLIQQAVAIDRERNDRRSEAIDLGDLGLAYTDLGRLDEAIDHYRQAASIATEIGDRRIQANALVNLANAYVTMDRLGEAGDLYQEALTITRPIGNPWGEGAILTNIGLVYEEMGRTEEAIEHYRKALEILEQIEAPETEVVRQLLENVRQ